MSSSSKQGETPSPTPTFKYEGTCGVRFNGFVSGVDEFELLAWCNSGNHEHVIELGDVDFDDGGFHQHALNDISDSTVRGTIGFHFRCAVEGCDGIVNQNNPFFVSEEAQTASQRARSLLGNRYPPFDMVSDLNG